MGSKTNRNLLAKHDKAKRQRREAVEAENMKARYVLAKARDRAALAAAYAASAARDERRGRLSAHF